MRVILPVLSKMSSKMLVCSCSEHNNWNEEHVAGNIYRIKSKKFKVATVTYMVTQNLIPAHAIAICCTCVHYVERNLLGKVAKLEGCSNELDIVINNINSGKLTDVQLKRLVEAVGQHVNRRIQRCPCPLSNTDVLLDQVDDVHKYLKGKDEHLVAFVAAVAGDASLHNPKKAICISSAVDSIYKAKDLSFVSPLSFCRNLISYYVSGSKVVTNLNASHHGAGSYSTIRRWLQTMGERPCDPPVHADTVTFFDNNQVIARNWRVTYNYKCQVSVVTNVVHIQSGESKDIQQQQDLSPRNWLHSITPDVCVPMIEDQLRSGYEDFDAIRMDYLQHRIQRVMQTQMNNEEFPAVQEVDPYEWVPEQQQQPTKVTLAEPILCNPCSYQSVQKVLETIMEQCGVGATRQWIAVGCDGLPYTLGSRLIQKKEELQSILLIPGAGHIEMNMVKGCFKLLWEVVLQDVAKMLGFRTPRALAACHNCSDHHKSWQILCILFYGTMDEILRMYIETEQNEPSVSGLYAYIKTTQNTNLRFMADVMFEIILPVFVYRCGMRRNNSKYMQAGKIKFANLFFGLNMTSYQELFYKDLQTRAMAPQHVKDFMSRSESYSVSGHSSKGEGGDFVLEAVNRKTKRWLPCGIPTEKHWKNVCRNMEILEKVRNKTMGALLLSDETTEITYHRCIDVEVGEWRKKLQTSKYLSSEDGIRRHTSFSGKKLDCGLISFSTSCSTNLNTYFTARAQGSPPEKRVPLTPVFTTPEDRSHHYSIEKQTKAKIIQMVEETIVTIRTNGDTEQAVILQTQWQKTKGLTKDELIIFYKEVCIALQNSTAVDSSDDSHEDSDNDDSEMT